jgi:hypothetical protein
MALLRWLVPISTLATFVVKLQNLVPCKKSFLLNLPGSHGKKSHSRFLTRHGDIIKYFWRFPSYLLPARSPSYKCLLLSLFVSSVSFCLRRQKKRQKETKNARVNLLILNGNFALTWNSSLLFTYENFIYFARGFAFFLVDARASPWAVRSSIQCG